MEAKKDYRPWGICGNERVVEFLRLAIINKQLAHAYLFVGPAHVGKNEVARKFISSIFCLNQQDSEFCGQCHHCRQLKNGLHPDFYFIERRLDEKTDKLKRDITIEQIRELKNKLQQGSLLGHYKVALISGAQYLNQNAANALLKLLEEPTPKTVIILLVDEPEAVPQTILSRCQVLRFSPVAHYKIESFLSAAGLELSSSQQLSHLAVGLPGLALEFSRNKEFLMSYNQDISNLLKIPTLNISGRLKLAANLMEWQDDETFNIARLNQLFDRWQTVLHDLIIIIDNRDSLMININLLGGLKILGERLTFTGVKRLFQLIKEARDYSQQNISSKLILENLIINL